MFNPRTFENARPDGFPILEIMPRPDRPDGAATELRQFVPLQRTELTGEIAGPVASLHLTQRFRFSAAQQPKPIEAAYRFPLPGDAAVTGVRVQFGETSILAELAERKQAEQAYQTARNEGRQATLLTREAPDVFTLQVTGLRPDEDITIQTSYVQLARPAGADWTLRVPLTTVPRYVRTDERGSAHAQGQPLALLRDPGHRFTLDLTLEGADAIASPTHALDVAASEGRLRVRLRDGEVIPDRDCVLSWQPQRQAGRPSLQMLRHQEASGNASCFLALVAPPAMGTASRTFPREVILLIDHSGSMEGPKWEAADWAVQNMLAGLTPDDTFNLGLFHSSTRWFARGPVRGDERTVRQAREFLLENRDSGGTELGVALEQALGQPRDAEGRARHVVIVTDAQVSDSGRILALVEREIGRADRRRVDVLCIDAAPNDGLANELAERGGGLARFLTSDPAENDIASALDELLADWAAPVLRNLALEIDSLDVQAAGRRVTFDQAAQVSLVDLGDLPAGRAVWVAGRIQRAHGGLPSVRLLADGQEIALELQADAVKPIERPAVAALFGARRVLDIELVQTSGIAAEERLRQLGYDPRALLDGGASAQPIYAENARDRLTAALHELLVRESLHYGIISSATAFVAARSEAGERVTDTVVVANALAHGWSNEFLMPRQALGGTAVSFMATSMPMPASANIDFLAQDIAPDSFPRFSRASSPRSFLSKPGGGPLDAARSFVRRFLESADDGAAEASEPAGSSHSGLTVIFSGAPRFTGGEAVLFDSAANPGSLPSGERLSRLTVRLDGGEPVDGGLTIALYVDDLTSPRATIRLADLLRQGGERPLNIRRQLGGEVRIVLLDANGAWAAGGPELEVMLG